MINCPKCKGEQITIDTNKPNECFICLKLTCLECGYKWVKYGTYQYRISDRGEKITNMSKLDLPEDDGKMFL